MAPKKKRRVASSEEESEEEMSSSPAKAQKGRGAKVFSDSDEDESDWSAGAAKKRKTPSKPAPRPGRKAAAKQLESSSDDNDSDTSVASDEENLFDNEEEKKKFESMTQVEREMFLYERQQKRELERERRKMLKELERKKRSQEGKEQKSEAPQPRRKPEPKKKQPAIEWSDSESEASASDEETPKKKDVRGRARERTPEPTVTLDDINSVRLSRHKLETWVGQLFFESTVKGCFVRINIGSHDGHPIYRIVEVVDLVQSNSRAYTFNGKPCNILLQCKFGEHEKQFQMRYVSNTAFVEAEFNKWKEEMIARDISFPTIQAIQERRKAIKDALNFRYTDEDVERMVQEKRKALKVSLFNPDMYVEQREMLVAEIAEAKVKLAAIADEDQRNEAQEEIDGLQRRIEELDQQAQDNRKQFDNRYGSISKINQRALARNIQSAPVVDDPRYVREPTRPIMLTVSEKQKLDEAKRRKEEQDSAKARKRAELEAIERKQDEAEAKRRESVDQTSLADLHDFDIGIDIDVSGIAVPPVAASVSSSATASKPLSLQEKRAMRLSDYKAKKGLI